MAAVVLAAGASSRMGGIKKEYQKLKDSELTVLGSSVSVFAGIPDIKTIVIAIPANEETLARNALPPGLLTVNEPEIVFVNGGSTRRASVFNALAVLQARNPRYVLIHDGARPWVSPSLAGKTIEAAQKHGAVIPLLPVTDTPKETFNSEQGGVFIGRHLKRSRVGLAQTPQVFLYPEILQAHMKAAEIADEDFTDDAEIWGRFCGQVAVVPGEPENRKITFPEDIA